MLIIEGPDGAGKSTLIKQITEQFTIPVADRVVDTDALPLGNLQEWVMKENRKGWQPKLFDRHRMISEPIYAAALNRPAAPGFDDLVWMSIATKMFYKANPIIIYCIPPFAHVLANCENDETNQWLVPHIGAIYNSYLARASIDLIANPLSCLVYDYTTDGKEDDPLGSFRGVLRSFDKANKEQK